MSEWNLVSLKEIVNNLDNKRVPLNSSQRELKESKPLYPYIGANNIMGYIDEYIFDEKILCVAEDGGSWGYNQKCAVLYNEKVWVNNHAHVITAKENLVLEYLMYYLNHTDLNLYINGATRGKLTKSSLESIQVPLPTLPQQKKIANILDAADALRQNDKALIAKYDELTQALFLDMFGDYLNDKLYPLKDLVKFSQGQQFGIEQQLLEPKEGYARFLRIVDYTQGEDLRFVPNNSKNYYVSKEDIVIVRYGASAGFVGTNKEGVLANNLFKVNYDKQMYNQAFLYFIFQNDRFKKFVNKEAFGAAMPALSFKVMERFEIPVPPLHIQNQFAERVAVIEEQKFIAQKSLEHSESLFNSLLQKAFKGELV